MNNRGRRFAAALSGPLFSPRGFATRAAWLAVFFVVCHLAGLREHTAFLSGTPGSPSTTLTTSAVLGIIYISAYYGLVLVAPILLIAAGLFFGLEKLMKRRTAPPNTPRE